MILLKLNWYASLTEKSPLGLIRVTILTKLINKVRTKHKKIRSLSTSDFKYLVIVTTMLIALQLLLQHSQQ